MVDCVICQLQSSKYKCVACYIPFCSVECGTRHKAAGDCRPVKPEPPATAPVGHYTDDTVPSNTLDRLGCDQKMVDLLKDPELRSCLKTLDSSENANENLQKAMQLPVFREFADACMAVVEDETS